MLTLDADLQQTLEKGSSVPVYLVTLTVKSQTASAESGVDYETVELKFCTGDRPLKNVTLDADPTEGSESPDRLRTQAIIPNTIVEIQSFGQQLDALTRAVSMADTEITMIDDGTIRHFLDSTGVKSHFTEKVNDYYLFNSKVVISIGDQSLNISKFQPLGTFTVSEILPQEGIITLECLSLSNLASSFTVDRNFKARDPWTQLDQLLRWTAALSDSSLDRASYDPDYGYTPATDVAPTVDATKRHYVTRQDDNDAGDEEYYKTEKRPKGASAWKLVNAISLITRGFVFQTENGKITYTPWDADKAVSRHLTSSDVDTFSQTATYSNTINRVTSDIKSCAGTTSFDPWTDIYGASGNANSSVQRPNRPTSAYFGGVEADTSYTTDANESAKNLQYPDAGTASYSFGQYYWSSQKLDLDWCSGMASCSFLRAPTICTNKDFGMENSYGDLNRYGTAYYRHEHSHPTYGTLGRVQLGGYRYVAPGRPGYLNCTNPSRPDYIWCMNETYNATPIWTGQGVAAGYPDDGYANGRAVPNDGAADSIFIPLCSPVIRVVDTSAEAQADGVVCKEGLIARIDNTNVSGTVLWIDWKYDNTTEFTADWGDAPDELYDWIILLPQYPVFPLIVSRHTTATTSGPIGTIGGARNIGAGRIMRPHNVKTDGTEGALTLDYQRYFYVQHAALAGFCGLGIRPGHATPTPSTPESVLQSIRYHGPISHLNREEFVAFYGTRSITPGLMPDRWGIDGQYIWGHNWTNSPLHPGVPMQQGIPQLRPQERVDREGSGLAKFSYVMLEYDELDQGGAGIKREIIKCNQAYFGKQIANWLHFTNQSRHHFTDLTGQLGTLHRYAQESQEPPSEYDSTSSTSQKIASCGVLRVDAQSATIETATSPSGNVTYPIKPSGRAVDGTNAYTYYMPQGLTTWASHYSMGVTSTPFLPGAPGVSQEDIDETTRPAWFWAGLKATDITIAKDVNQQILNRFSYGMPVVEITTNLRHIDLQLGDFVSLDSDVYLKYGKSGSDSYTVFEITRKELDLSEDSPRITFELCWVRQDTNVEVTLTFNPPDVMVKMPVSVVRTILDLEGTIVFDYGGDIVRGGGKMPAGGKTYEPTS